MQISGCFDNENGAPVPGSFVAGDAVSNSAVGGAMSNEAKARNTYLRSHLKS